MSRGVLAMSLGNNMTLPLRRKYTAETPCTRMVGGTYESLAPHLVSCGPQHAISSIRLTDKGCLDNRNEPGSMHFVFTCIGIARYVENDVAA